MITLTLTKKEAIAIINCIKKQEDMIISNKAKVIDCFNSGRLEEEKIKSFIKLCDEQFEELNEIELELIEKIEKE